MKTPTKKILLKKNDPLARAAKKIISQQTSRMRANTHGALTGRDPEALHNLRVASRRTRVAIEVFGRIFGRARAEAILAELSVTGKILGEVRDMDVLISGLGPKFIKLETPKNSQKRIIEFLTHKQTLSHKALKRSLESKKFRGLLDKIDSLNPLPNSSSPYPASTASKMITKRASRDIVEWKDCKAEKLSAKDLHRLRLAFKKLRYICEFFCDYYGAKTKKAIKSLVLFQDTLGHYHDSDKAVLVLEDIGRRTKIKQLDKLIKLENKNAEASRKKFLKLWKRFPDTPKGTVRYLGIK
jgi:triphosphatase